MRASVRGSLGSMVGVAAFARAGRLIAILAVAALTLTACDTLGRHGHGADDCNCYAGVYRDTPPLIGHGWKI